MGIVTTESFVTDGTSCVAVTKSAHCGVVTTIPGPAKFESRWRALDAPRNDSSPCSGPFVVTDRTDLAGSVRGGRDQSERSEESAAFRRRKRVKQTAFGPFRSQPGAAQNPPPGMGNRNLIGSRVRLGPVARQQPARKHAANHFGQS